MHLPRSCCFCARCLLPLCLPGLLPGPSSTTCLPHRLFYHQFYIQRHQPPVLTTRSLPSPFLPQEHARYANGGAYPPDLSLITKARHDGQNYVFSLLLGYREPPAGISVSKPLLASTLECCAGL